MYLLTPVIIIWRLTVSTNECIIEGKVTAEFWEVVTYVMADVNYLATVQ